MEQERSGEDAQPDGVEAEVVEEPVHEEPDAEPEQDEATDPPSDVASRRSQSELLSERDGDSQSELRPRGTWDPSERDGDLQSELLNERAESEDEVVHTTDGEVRQADEADDDAETIPVAETRTPDPTHEHEAPEEESRVRVSLSPTLTILLGLAAGAVAISGLREVSGIIAPTFLAMTLIIAVYPVYKVLRRFLGSIISGLLLIVMLYGILAFLGASIGLAASRFATELARPEYTSTFTGLVRDGRDLLLERGIEAQEIDEAISNFDLRNLTGLATSLANTITGLTTTMLFLLTVMIFLVMDAGGFKGRLSAIHRHKPDVADALVDFGYRVRKYWIVSTVFGIIVAVIDYFALVWLGVPLAMTFGLLAFVTNYIPNIGFVLGLIPPAFIALLSGGVSTMIWVIAIYCVVNFVIQSIFQPKFTGDAVGINATTAFLSLVFWAYVFGALGALLAIPCTLLVKSLLIDRDPRARWINQFIASDPRERRSAQPT
ncbi:Predicted PurR-regulated permease PerM [Janibacter indicus]|uniref:Predicted PurR-regulated permease PerM n=1 Tax=Janibacter indicus TaxID=857417 RepID=A0A1W2CE78_9MICO|nr:Predicted PurR-regulated permease PerM [Janibacter indicus]